jgi:5-methylcytosine-specific restriction endonuclease McrA
MAHGDVSAAEWAAIVEYFDGRCAYCLRVLAEDEVTQDHVIALVRGGTHTPDNVVPCCGRCNSRKHSKLVLAMVNVRVQCHIKTSSGPTASGPPSSS